MRSTLASPRLRRILAAYTVNRLGTWFAMVALSVAVFNETGSAFAVAGVLIAGQVLPAFAVPFLVARVEESRRGRELSGLYFFEAVVAATLAVLLWHFWLPAVLLLVALDGTAALAASALLRTETARAAREELEPGADRNIAEQKANAALNVAFSATFVAGPAIGGAIVAGPGAPTALFLDAASFLLCGCMLLDLHSHVEEAAGTSVRARLLAAWGHIRQARTLRALLIAQAVAFVFFESAGPIEVAYAKLSLHAGNGGYGLLVSAWGVGVVLGGIAFARWGVGHLRAMVGGGTLAIGLAYVGFALAPSILVACLTAVIGGVGNGVQWAPLVSAVQRLTPPGLHGRVMGALEALGALCPAIGLALGAALVTLTSPRTAFLVVGVGALLTTIAFVRIPLDAAPQAPAEPLTAEPADPLADHPRPATSVAGEPTPH
jgi:ENTS family enterobactin (siderophore) exporter